MILKQKHLIEFQMYYVLIFGALIDIFHFPNGIRYLLDFNAIFICAFALPKVYDMLKDKVFRFFNIYVILFMAAVIVVAAMRTVPPGRILWATRNNFIYITFFLSVAYTLKPSDIHRIMKNITKFQPINVLFVLFEYVVLGRFGDFIGGMFGSSPGCNGLLNIYLCVITTYAISTYISKRNTLSNMLWISISSLAIAVIAELKFFYIEFVVIVALSLILSRASFKSGFLVIGAVAALFVGIQIMGAISPDTIAFLQDFDSMVNYASNDFNGTLVTRATSISQINQWFFSRRPKYYYLFGYGFGYCENSQTFSWANSSFAIRYGSTGYRNLSTASLYLETGMLGLIGFIGIFIFLFLLAQQQKEILTKSKYILVFSQIISIIAIMNIWYNASIKREIAYLTFFCLSAVIIFARDKMREPYGTNEPEQEYHRPTPKFKLNIRF